MCVGQTEIGASDIADGGETAVQHLAHDAGAVRRQIGRGPGGKGAEIGGRGGDVDMRVDQAGHHHRARQVQHRYVIGSCQSGAGLGDPAVGAAQVALGQVTGSYVQKQSITQQQNRLPY